MFLDALEKCKKGKIRKVFFDRSYNFSYMFLKIRKRKEIFGYDYSANPANPANPSEPKLKYTDLHYFGKKSEKYSFWCFLGVIHLISFDYKYISGRVHWVRHKIFSEPQLKYIDSPYSHFKSSKIFVLAFLVFFHLIAIE